MTKKDYVAEIMDKWYKAMEKQSVGVQPTASTIMGTILASYDVQPKTDTRDIWEEYLTITGGEFQSWWASLSPTERKEFEIRRVQEREKWEASRKGKQLLKG